MTVVECPSCRRPAGDGDAFCEYCGQELTPAQVSAAAPDYVPACPLCAVDPSVTDPGVTADGYCENCGRKVPSGRDHIELDLGLVYGVTDRGLRHARNEDAMALATADVAGEPVAIAVICDGVSSSPRPDDASLAGARAAVRVLLESARAGYPPPEEASREAVRAAFEALARLNGPDGAPAATYAAALVTGGSATLCWLGDSRIYWLAESGSERLTTDDSLASDIVASGLMEEAQALTMPQAHVITRWLGADMTEAPDEHIVAFTPPGPGVLMLCTDGLWNYQPGAAELASMTLPQAAADPAGAAGGLLKFALDSGGMDNITIVLVRFPLALPDPPPAASPPESTTDRSELG